MFTSYFPYATFCLEIIYTRYYSTHYIDFRALLHVDKKNTKKQFLRGIRRKLNGVIRLGFLHSKTVVLYCCVKILEYDCKPFLNYLFVSATYIDVSMKEE